MKITPGQKIYQIQKINRYIDNLHWLKANIKEAHKNGEDFRSTLWGDIEAVGKATEKATTNITKGTK